MLLIIAPKWKEPKCSNDEWINKIGIFVWWPIIWPPNENSTEGTIEHLLGFVAIFAELKKSRHQALASWNAKAPSNESQVFVTAKHQLLKSGTEKINEQI